MKTARPLPVTSRTRRHGTLLCLLGTVALTLSACEAVNAGSATDPASPMTRAQARIVNVDQYFSAYLYGPTLRLYDYKDANVILALRFSNRQTPIRFTAALHEFAPDATRKDISKWINNQHSDALYGDAAEPQKISNVQNRIRIISTKKSDKGPTQGRSGESYDDYQVTFRVRSIETQSGRIDGFTDTVIVHVRRQTG